MVLDRLPADRAKHTPSPHYAAVQLRNGQSKANASASKFAHQRNARHYKSSLVLNCAGAGNGGGTSSNGTLGGGAAANNSTAASPSNASSSSSGSSSMALMNHPPPSRDAPPAQGLPRLANALKSLISSAGINASFKSSKSAFVDAGDEVIYYSNVVASPNAGAANGKSSQNGGGAAGELMPSKPPRRSPSLNRIDKIVVSPDYAHLDEAIDDRESQQFSASSSSHYFAHRQPTTLEQIRQLYKSVPNFNSFDDGEEEDEERGINCGGQQQPPIPSRKLEARIGRLCPGNAGENPPPLQTQRKRLSAGQSAVQKINGGMGGKVVAAGKSPLSCGTPSSSAASSLSSSNSARSMPIGQANGEQVAEQCEKMVKPASCQIKSTSSLASCSLDSDSSGPGKNATKIPPGKKFSPTDSGYRSRGETPKAGSSNAGAGGEGNPRGRPLSMICPSSEFEFRAEEAGGGKSQHFPPFPSSPTNRPQEARECLRKYIWTEKAVVEEVICKWPFEESELGEWIGESMEGNVDEGMAKELAKMLHKTFAELAKKFWQELRRLSGVLVKCTLMDIGTAALLLFPSQIAWQCLNYATKSTQYLDKSANANNAEAIKLPIGDRARLQYFGVGEFYQWMMASKMATIVDERAATFLSAIFDFLLLEFTKLLKASPKGEHWPIKLKDPGLLPLLAQSRLFSKSIHILRPPASNQTSLAAFAEILANLPLAKLVFPSEFVNLEAEMFGGQSKLLVAFGNCAVLALHFWLNCAERRGKAGSGDLEDWARKSAIFAIHRGTALVEEEDVLQAARLILPDFDCPPPLADHFNLDANFSPTIKAIILGENDRRRDEGEGDGMPRKMRPNVWPAELAGWTPLCWAIALERADLVEEMLRRRPSFCREVRNQAEPLKICAQTGNLAICELLLRHGANPFAKPLAPPNCPFHSSQMTAFADAAAHANAKMLQMFIGCCAAIRRTSAGRQMLLLMGENEENKKGGPLNDFQWNLPPKLGAANFLSDPERRAFCEAIWMAAECGHRELAFRLKKAVGEMPWPNAGIWLQCLEWLMGKMDEKEGGENEEKDLVELLEEFGPKMGEELMAEPRGQKRAELFAKLLFKLLMLPSTSSSNSTRIRGLAARLLASQFQQIQKGSLCQLEREFSAYFPGHFAATTASESSTGIPPAHQSTPQIDPKFVDCPDLSDIRFRFADGQIVFAHRIVLVNASEQFRQILRSPSGVVEVPNANADAFRLLLEFAYGNLAKCARQIGKSRAEQQIQLIGLARRFGLEKLVEIGQKALGAGLCVERFRRIYAFAKELDLPPLVEDCERFGLANLPELMQIFGGGEGSREWAQMMAKMEAQFRAALRESRI